MRITGGIWASRRVAGPPRSLGIRPTPDALREQAFGVLAEELPGARFLDLFAGTGVDALEALSRGAAQVILVEPNRKACELIRGNLALFDLSPEQAQLLPMAAAGALALLDRNAWTADIVWADPPFAEFPQHLSTLQLLKTGSVLRPGGALVVECPPKTKLEIAGFALERTLRGGVLLRRRG